MKGGLHPEGAAVAHAARVLGRPVLWESDRSEALLSDPAGREADADIAIGFDRDHRIVALEANVDLNLGAYLTAGSGSAVNNIGSLAGVYDVPSIAAVLRGVLTNTPPTAAYRGAGRPEAVYYIERILDLAAAELGLSPLELRQRNLIAPAQMPYRTGLTFTYDCGDFPALVERGTKLADLAGFPSRRAEAEARGRLLGQGIALCIEASGGPVGRASPDSARLSLLPDGRLRIEPGSFSVGQGLETAFPQIVAERFGLTPDEVLHRQGDSEALGKGRDNGGSGSLCVGGPAVADAIEGLETAILQAAAQHIGCDAAVLCIADGMIRQTGTNRSLSLTELARSLPQDEAGLVLAHRGHFQPQTATFPNGMHVAEVEIDPETGERRVTRYAAVEDLGRVLNPEFVDGQMHGGIVQALGQALGESMVYDADGQLLTGSFMDYAMPHAADQPGFHLGHSNVPTKVNPLGLKGVGEAGTVGALSATMNAVNDALRSRGVRHLDMPATPARIRDALRHPDSGLPPTR